MAVWPAAGRPREPARHGGSATSPLAFQTPPPLLRARSTSPGDLDKHAAPAFAYPDYLPHRPRTSLPSRSEEHTSELQSQSNLVCRLLLEKKKNMIRLKCADHVRQRRPSDPHDLLH